MKKYKHVILLTCMAWSLLPTFRAEAAVTLGLEECVEMALQNDETISEAESGKKSAKWQLSSARRESGPTISWTSEAYRIGGQDYQSLNERHDRYGDDHGAYAYHNTFSNSVSLQIPIYSGGRIEENIKGSRYRLYAADFSLESTKQTVRYNAVSAYYNVIQQENLLRVAENAVQMTSEQLAIVQKQFSEGVAARSDVMQVEVQQSSYLQSRINAQGELAVAKATLARTVGLPSDTELAVAGSLSYEPCSLSLEECEAFALEHRADAAAIACQVKQAKSEERMARSGNLPSVNVVAQKNISSNIPFHQERSENWLAGLQVGWNVFDNQLTAANIKTAEAEREKLETEALKLQNDILLEIRSAYFRMRAAEKNIQPADDNMKQAEKYHRIVCARYEEGVDTLLNVTDAEEKLTQARTNYYTSLYNYNIYKAELEKAIGVSVDLDVPRYLAEIKS